MALLLFLVTKTVAKFNRKPCPQFRSLDWTRLRPSLILIKRENMKNIKSLWLLVFFSLFAVPTSAQNRLEGEWKMVRYNFSVQIAFPIDTMEITLNVNKNGKISGKSGCNDYGGNFTDASGGKLKVSSLFATKMACEGQSMMFEGYYLKTLEASDTYSFKKDGRLVLMPSGTMNSLTFERRKPLKVVKKTKIKIRN